MGLAHNIGVQDAGGTLQRVHSRVNTQGRDFTAEHRGGVQVGEGGGRGRVREVIGRNIHGLYRGDGPVFGGSDALLHLTHFRGQGGLVTHGGRHAAQKGAHLTAGLGETEDIVDEKEDVPRACTGVAVAEALCQGEAAQGHAGTGSRGFVHLAEHHGYLALFQFFRVYQREVPLALFHGFFEGVSVADYLGFDHFPQKVVALTGALSHAGKHGKTVVRLGNVVDELLDEHRFAHAGAAEQADFTAFEVRLQQVDDLDTGKQHFLAGGEVLELGGLPVDGQGAFPAEFRHAVDGISGNVHDTAADLRTYGHGNGPAGILYLQSAAETVRGIHGHATHGVLTNVLLHLQDDGFSVRALDR